MSPSTSNFNVIYFGEALFDLLENQEIPGGAPLNCTYHLSKLGIHSFILTKLGNDLKGAQLIDIIKRAHINPSLIQIDPLQPTGIAKAQLKTHSSEVYYEFNQPCAWDFIEPPPSHTLPLLDQSHAFIFGSLALRNPTSRKTLFELLKKTSFRVLDLNLRPPHFEPQLIKKLLAYTHLLKLNEHEFNYLAQYFDLSRLSKSEKINFFFHHSPLEEILLSKGKEGLEYFNKQGLTLSKKTPLVQIKDTIGSGDAFLAGFLAAKLQGKSLEHALNSALLMGAFITTHHGACPNYNLPQLQAFEKTLA